MLIMSLISDKNQIKHLKDQLKNSHQLILTLENVVYSYEKFFRVFKSINSNYPVTRNNGEFALMMSANDVRDVQNTVSFWELKREIIQSKFWNRDNQSDLNMWRNVETQTDDDILFQFLIDLKKDINQLISEKSTLDAKSFLERFGKIIRGQYKTFADFTTQTDNISKTNTCEVFTQTYPRIKQVPTDSTFVNLTNSLQMDQSVQTDDYIITNIDSMSTSRGNPYDNRMFIEAQMDENNNLVCDELIKHILEPIDYNEQNEETSIFNVISSNIIQIDGPINGNIEQLYISDNYHQNNYINNSYDENFTQNNSCLIIDENEHINDTYYDGNNPMERADVQQYEEIISNHDKYENYPQQENYQQLYSPNVNPLALESALKPLPQQSQASEKPDLQRKRRTYMRKANFDKVWHKCDFNGCSFGSLYSGVVERHINDKHRGKARINRTQTIVNRFDCDWPNCRASLVTYHKLVEHMRKHTGEKPFKCRREGCNYATGRKYSMRIHDRTHLTN